MEENFDFIAKHFRKEMKSKPAVKVYNLFSKYIKVSSIDEAKEILHFIQGLQNMDDYLEKFIV